jgi:hypothetical protein
LNRRVFDSFLFCDELDLLEARLIELDDAVYRHVLVEAPVTFQGNPKPLHYQENRDRFAPWKSKIIHVVMDLESCQDSWERERASRDGVQLGLSELRDDDIFMLSDADEIPDPAVIQKAPGNILAMRHHMLAVNLLELGWWAGTLAVLGKDYRFAISRFLDRQIGQDRPFLRDPVGFPLVTGWHFSWLGGPEGMRSKVHSFSHPEQAARVDADAEKMYREKINPVNGDNRLLEVVIDGSFPKFMQERRGPEAWYWPGNLTPRKGKPDGRG